VKEEINRFPKRSERARQTRQRVVSAAIHCFVADGYPATTMVEIAKRGEVAVQTLYATFKTKRAILASAIDIAIAGDDEPVPVNERPWMRPVWDATTGPATLRAYAAAVRVIQERSAHLFRVLDSAAAVEPELTELWQVSRERRRFGAAGVVNAAVQHSPLSNGVTTEQAIDLLWTFNGHQPYLDLVDECGWSPETYQNWLGDSLSQLLFGSGLA